MVVAHRHIYFPYRHGANTLYVLNVTVLNSFGVGNVKFQQASLVHTLPGHHRLSGIDSDYLVDVKMEGLVKATLETARRAQQYHQDKHTPGDREPRQRNTQTVALHSSQHFFE